VVRISKEREAMNAALNKLVVPTLRAKGFKGSLPHFRRVGNGATEVLTFQFDRHGGGFVMQIGPLFRSRLYYALGQTHTIAAANRLGSCAERQENPAA
jgi:hypothetical protein